MIVTTADYADFKIMLASLQPHGFVFYWGGSGSEDWGCMFASFDAKLIIKSGSGQTNPSPPPGFIQPSSFSADFPNAIALAAAPTFA